MRKPGCLRVFVCAVCVPALVVCASFVPVAPARARGSSCAHISCLPTRLVWALFVFAWGCALLGLVVGVFACGWLGFGVCATARVRLGCLRFLGVGALAWGGGAVWSRRPLCPGLLACLLACSRPGVGAVGVCGVLRCPMGGGWPCWGGTWLSRPVQRGGVPSRCVARGRESGGAPGVLTRARTRREG